MFSIVSIAWVAFMSHNNDYMFED